MAGITVELIDSMGNDLSVVNAARVSFAKESEWEYAPSEERDGYGDPIATVTRLSDKDTRLINFLARERHELPFAHTAVTLRCSAPLPQRVHCFKSKIGLVENEESRRYISTRPELFVPEFREAAKDKKQGSGGTHTAWEDWRDDYMYYANKMIDKYEAMIDDGIAPEQARYILPQGVMVNWIWTGSLLAYARFYNLRSRPDTQKETQDVARQVGDIMSGLWPVSWPALTA